MAKLLLVEDDNNLREIYEARLQAEGYDIVSAKDGEEALVVAKAEKPDLIVSDVMMPKISGFEMLDILRNTEELKHVKIIMLTALGQSDDQQRADRLGADRYLVKSQVTLEDIVKVAHELLQDQTEAEAQASSPSATPVAEAAPAPTPVVAPESVAAAPAIPPAPEPVAAAPAVTPSPSPEPAAVIPEPNVAAPAGTPAVEPVATSGTVASPAADTDKPAQSAAQEEANVEAQIEDFVTGANTEAPAAVASSETPAPQPGVIAPTVPAASPASDSSADDVLMAGAVQGLVDSASPSPSVAAPEPANDTATTAAPALVAPDSAAPASPAPSAPTAGVHIANKKIISPIDAEPQKDIHTLLAMEETAEKAAQDAALPATETPGEETGTTALAAPAAPQPETPKLSTSAPSAVESANPASEIAPAPDDPSSIAL